MLVDERERVSVALLDRVETRRLQRCFWDGGKFCLFVVAGPLLSGVRAAENARLRRHMLAAGSTSIPAQTCPTQRSWRTVVAAAYAGGAELAGHARYLDRVRPHRPSGHVSARNTVRPCSSVTLREQNVIIRCALAYSTCGWGLGRSGRDETETLAPLAFGWSGKITWARSAASRIVCASISERVSAIPAARHSHTNPTGPGGGSGHTPTSVGTSAHRRRLRRRTE
jgi:hypothetical protein